MKKFFSFNPVIIFFVGIGLLGASSYFRGATNFDRLVLGSGNFGTDPNSTADLTFQNDEYIENGTDGRLGFGAANLLTTGTLGSGALTVTGAISATTTITATTNIVGKFGLFGQGQNTALVTFAVKKHDGTNVATIDTVGNGVLVGLTLTGAIDGGATIAGIDSFLTTAVVDTITITGVAVGDLFTFAEYTPAYSSAIDTVVYSYVCETNKVIVARTGMAAGAAYKSGGLYSYHRVK